MTTTVVPLGVLQQQSIRESTGRVNVLVGSIRAGKTVASLLRFLIAVATAGTDGEIVITGKNRGSIYRNVMQPLMSPALFGPVAKRVQYNNNAPTARILGRVVHIIGANDVSAEEAIRGMTVLIWYGDEVTVHPEGFVTQMLGRMSPAKAIAFLTTNPDGPQHWFKKKFLDRTLPGWRTWKFTLDDNPTLTEEYKNSIKAELTGVWYRRFILGEWAAAEGAIYDLFDPDRHCGPLPDDVTIVERIVGLDYGTVNATAAVLLGLGDDRRIYVLDEWGHNARAGQARWTDAEISAGLRNWLPDDLQWVVVDPSAASFIEQLHRDGVRVDAADNAVADGIRRVASLMAIGRLRIVHAPSLVDEIPGYVWDEKAVAKGEDKPVKENDHYCDALRYAVAAAHTVWYGRIDWGVTDAAALERYAVAA